jgi:hypothetical protein
MRLYQQIPRDTKLKAEANFETLILTAESLVRVADLPNLPTEISMLAKTRHAGETLPGSAEAKYEIEIREPVIGDEKLGCHGIGFLSDEPNPEVKVIVEFKRYNDPSAKSKMCLSVQEIAILRKTLHHGEQFGLLSCLGFYHDDNQPRYGLVYKHPIQETAGDAGRHIRTVFDVLSDAKVLPPPLAYRFKLAHSLAAAVSFVHKIGWVHKGLRSSNVIVTMALKEVIHLTEPPFLIGFEHSRPDESKISTEGPSQDKDGTLYQHPAYLATDCNYTQSHDYYSLGMLLLEVGHWRPLAALVNLKNLTPNEARTKLTEKRVPTLGHLMGETYQSIVEICLGNAFEHPEYRVDVGVHCAHEVQVKLDFEKRVLSQLLALSKLPI